MATNFKSKLDEVDKRIINILLEDAQMPYSEVAKRAFVSSGTVHVRLKKLRALGVIQGVQLKVNYNKLGYDVKAFLGIYLEKSIMYEDVLKELTNIPEVTNIDYTTGNYAMFVKILCEDTNHLRKVLHEKIQRIEGISRTETIISLNEDVNRNIEITE